MEELCVATVQTFVLHSDLDGSFPDLRCSPLVSFPDITLEGVVPRVYLVPGRFPSPWELD